MHPTHKIATCCYCGSTTTLTLTGTTRHQLACASCGAPISRLKHLPLAPAPARTETRNGGSQRAKPRKAPKPKKRKSAPARLLDLAEDILDIFD